MRERLELEKVAKAGLSSHWSGLSIFDVVRTFDFHVLNPIVEVRVLGKLSVDSVENRAGNGGGSVNLRETNNVLEAFEVGDCRSVSATDEPPAMLCKTLLVDGTDRAPGPLDPGRTVCLIEWLLESSKRVNVTSKLGLV